jgi:DNA-binding beta-propeller fold protein YncE
VEGREFDVPQSVVVDRQSGALYVADTGNNRVLGWRDSRSFANGSAANIVVGQKDLFSNFQQGPGGELRESGLTSPTGVAVDSRGNLYVVDAGNNRILRYKRPFKQTATSNSPISHRAADLLTNTSSGRAQNRHDPSNTVYPPGWHSVDRNLASTDASNHRVLRYPVSALGEMVFGQPVSPPMLPGIQQQNKLNKVVLREPSGVTTRAAGCAANDG